MLGKKSGFVARMKKEAPYIRVTHCALHRHVLAAKSSPKQLKNMSIVLSAVNFIRGLVVNQDYTLSESRIHYLFKIFCNKVGAEHNILLYSESSTYDVDPFFRRGVTRISM